MRENPSHAARQSVAITVYNRGSSLVRDVRRFELAEGQSIVDFTDVAATIDARSVVVHCITDPDGTQVLEQNYVYDLVGTQALLKRYIDQILSVTAEDGTVYTGRLLSGQEGRIILGQDDGGVVVLNTETARDVRFPSLPDGLITRPTLRWLLQVATAGTQDIELTYLTRGLNWTADYNIVLHEGNDRLDLTGWVTVENNSGTAYQDATLKLVAGDVNRVQEFGAADEMMMVTRSAPRKVDVQQREMFEYQLYEVGRPVTVGNNETKQIEFVNGSDVPATQYYQYHSSGRNRGVMLTDDRDAWRTGVTTVETWLEFSTAEEGGLGRDMPAGNIRVYQRDTDGAALLIGENTIRHTPTGETVSILLGKAFDLVGERTQTDFRYVHHNSIEETFNIALRNRKDTGSVVIRVIERLFRYVDWEIVSASHAYSRVDVDTVVFRVEAAAGAEVIVQYTVRYAVPG